MKIKKIITWIFFILGLVGWPYVTIKASDNKYLILFTVIGLIVFSTLLIHLYSGNEKLKRITRKVWFFSLALLILGIILELTYLSHLNLVFPYEGIYFLSITFLLLMTSFYLIVSNRKVDMFIFIMMIVALLGMVMKANHLPLSGLIMTIGYSMPACLFLFIFYKRITEYDSRINRFLNFFKNFICGTLTVCFLGIVFKMQHWPGGDLLRYIGLPLSILTIFIIVFLLPGSNFIEWTKEHKRMFYRAFLIPLIYLSIFFSLAIVFPSTFQKIFYSKRYYSTHPFYIEKYDIPDKEGL